MGCPIRHFLVGHAESSLQPIGIECDDALFATTVITVLQHLRYCERVCGDDGECDNVARIANESVVGGCRGITLAAHIQCIAFNLGVLYIMSLTMTQLAVRRRRMIGRSSVGVGVGGRRRRFEGIFTTAPAVFTTAPYPHD